MLRTTLALIAAAWLPRRPRRAVLVRLASLATFVLLAACNPFAPATELAVVNELPVELNVRAAPCGLPTEAFAALAPGESRTRNVDPGCWSVEGWTPDGRMGAVEVTIAEHSLHRLPFFAVED